MKILIYMILLGFSMRSAYSQQVAGVSSASIVSKSESPVLKQLEEKDFISEQDFERDLSSAYNDIMHKLQKGSLNPKIASKQFKTTLMQGLREKYGFEGDFSTFAIKYPDKAIDIMAAQIKINPSADIYFSRGYAYYSNSDYLNAIADYTSALKLDPRHNDGWTQKMRGTAYLENGELDKAIADFNHVIESKSKKSGFAYSERAEAYVKEKQFALAAADLEAFFTSDAYPNHKINVAKSKTCMELVNNNVMVNGCRDKIFFTKTPARSYFRIIANNSEEGE